MRYLKLTIILVGCMLGCNGSSKPSPHYVTEQDARLISIARNAAVAEGFSLSNAVYKVRREGTGWIVQVDKAPGYSGVGEPSVVVDGTFFVKLTSDERVREILSSGRWIKSATRPAGGA